jgi:hypothetical protein
MRQTYNIHHVIFWLNLDFDMTEFTSPWFCHGIDRIYYDLDPRILRWFGHWDIDKFDFFSLLGYWEIWLSLEFYRELDMEIWLSLEFMTVAKSCSLQCLSPNLTRLVLLSSPQSCYTNLEDKMSQTCQFTAGNQGLWKIWRGQNNTAFKLMVTIWPC